MKREQHHPPKPDQKRAFIDTARAIGADENTSAADELLGRLAKMPPAPNSIGKLAQDKSAESKLGYFDDQSIVSDEVRSIMRDNSHAISGLTRKVPC